MNSRSYTTAFQYEWNRFWFGSGSATNLAVARILVALQSLWLLLSRDFAGISALPVEFWAQVNASTEWRYLAFYGVPGLERGLEIIAGVALVGVLVGFYTRLSCFIAGILLYHLAPLEAIIWVNTPYVRGLTLPILGLIVLSLSRCGDSLSLEHRRHNRASTDPPLDYAWQLRLIQLLLCLIYLFSGWSKLERSGLAWFSSDNIRRWILYLIQDPEVGVFRTIGTWIASSPTLCSAIGFGTVAFELGFIAVLFSKRLAVWLVPVAILFHFGILFTMNLSFVTMMLLPILIDWDSMLDGRKKRNIPNIGGVRRESAAAVG